MKLHIVSNRTTRIRSIAIVRGCERQSVSSLEKEGKRLAEILYRAVPGVTFKAFERAIANMRSRNQIRGRP